MPKGQPRTPEQRRADLLEQQAKLAAGLAELERKMAAKARKDTAQENYELGMLARVVLGADMGFKRKLVEAAGVQPLKDHQRKALERVLGPLPVKATGEARQEAAA
jgi:hypothetical protein